MNHEPASTLPLDHAQRSDRVKRNKATFNKKRDFFLQDLLRNLDLLIYAELSAVYYMECANICHLQSRILLTAPQLLLHSLPSPSSHTIHLSDAQTRLPSRASAP